MNSRSVARNDGHQKSIGTITVGGVLSISDSSYYFENPIKVALVPGVYEVIIYSEGSADAPIVRKLCVVQPEAAWHCGRVLGELLIDFAQIALADRESCDRALDTIPDDEMGVYYDQLNVVGPAALIDIGGASICVVRVPNDGDNIVRELLNEMGDRVGAEIDFGQMED
jgi:hypothetical protein